MVNDLLFLISAQELFHLNLSTSPAEKVKSKLVSVCLSAKVNPPQMIMSFMSKDFIYFCTEHFYKVIRFSKSSMEIHFGFPFGIYLFICILKFFFGLNETDIAVF